MAISPLPDIVQKCLCPQDGAMDPTFQMKYIPTQFAAHFFETPFRTTDNLGLDTFRTSPDQLETPGKAFYFSHGGSPKKIQFYYVLLKHCYLL